MLNKCFVAYCPKPVIHDLNPGGRGKAKALVGDLTILALLR